MSDAPSVPKNSPNEPRLEVPHPPVSPLERLATTTLTWARNTTTRLEPVEAELGEGALLAGTKLLGPIAFAAAALTPENAHEQIYDDNQRIAQRLGELPFDESRRVVFPPVSLQASAVQAMADFKRCYPKFRSFEGNSVQLFRRLKSALPNAPAGWHWHHLVEQSRTGVFGTEAIQNTANVIAIPDSLHSLINAEHYGKCAKTLAPKSNRTPVSALTLSCRYLRQNFTIRTRESFTWANCPLAASPEGARRRESLTQEDRCGSSDQHRSAEDRRRGRLLRPAQRHAAVQDVRNRLGAKERPACRWLGINRKLPHYRSRRNDEPLRLVSYSWPPSIGDLVCRA